MKDIIGMLCSVACVIHCALTPLLLLLGATSASIAFLEQEWIHMAFAVPMILLALISFPKSYNLHNNLVPYMIGATGLVLIIGSVAGPHATEEFCAVAGGLALITAHLMNRHYLTRFYKQNQNTIQQTA